MTRAVFTIPPGKPFVDALAAGILDGALGIDPKNPASLSRAAILLPTRRSCRALLEAFLRLSGGNPMVLPRIAPLGEIDEDLLEFSGFELSGPLAGDLQGPGDLPPALPPLRRQLLLTRLVLDHGKVKGGRPFTEGQAARLAAELARLLDQVQTERLSFDALETLVPEDFADHWQITLDFLKILTRHWPEELKREGAVDPAARRNLVLEAQTQMWLENPPAHPVIAAGSTGSLPATADLLSAVASLPKGAVVLPGLDRALDEKAWEMLDESHPQFSLARLLKRMELTRDDVGEWAAPGIAATAPARAALVSEAMRPAETTDAWRDVPPPPGAALAGVTQIDCPSPREEAGVIALQLREALETEGKRAALVTFDRALARRVAAELGRFGIAVDDSAGLPFAETPCGTFLRATVRMIAESCAPVPLLAALKHPLAAGGRSPGAFRAMARQLEMLALRGPAPAPGFKGLVAAIKEKEPQASARRALVSWVQALERMAHDFAQLMRRKRAPLAELIAAHTAFAESLAATDAETGAARLWSEDSGEAGASFLSELLAAGRDFPAIAPQAYADVLEAVLEGQVVRPAFGRHRRLFIWGPLEARLQQVERVILGGLNEGTWPPRADPDSWMSRPMRGNFGLPQPERRVGLSAHDFAQLFCAPEVTLTRASRVEGTPTVPSRWLLRLDNLLPVDGKIRRGGQWLEWFASLDRPHEVRAAEPPAPRPPVGVRPRRLSVTAVETLIRDPYAIYARHILNLEPLPLLDADPGAAERGSFIHDVLDSFVAAHPRDLPEDAVALLTALGEETFGSALARPGVRAFWWPRFLRIARWFADFERTRRGAGFAVIGTEMTGALKLGAPAGSFELIAKADRIDRIGDGIAILDYKTGLAPAQKQIEAGLTPQLTLEAAIARNGGFAGVSATEIAALTYVVLTGRDPPGEEKPVKGDLHHLAGAALAGLIRLVAAYDDSETAYRSRPRPMFARRAGDYDHLARVKEWSSAMGESP